MTAVINQDVPSDPSIHNSKVNPEETTPALQENDAIVNNDSQEMKNEDKTVVNTQEENNNDHDKITIVNEVVANRSTTTDASTSANCDNSEEIKNGDESAVSDATGENNNVNRENVAVVDEVDNSENANAPRPERHSNSDDFPKNNDMRWIFAFAILTAVSCHPPDEQYSWGKLDYNFPNESMRAAYIASGDFVQADNLPVGVAVWKDKMFITVPRWKKGVPANLNYIPMAATTDKSPPLNPYPSWEANDVHSSNNDVIISIFRVRVDACDRLWGVDTGIDDILGDTKVVRPPRLIVIDLKTDKILRTYTLKDSDQKADSFFGDLAVDSDKDACDDTHAYLSDLGGYGLVVYSLAKNDSWRFHHNYFHFDPLNGDFNVTGINFHWTDGVFGMAVSPKREDGTKTLYFHALSAIREFSVPTEVLKNESYASADNYYLFQLVGEKGPLTQGTSSAMDADTGIIYYTQTNRHGLACWNTKIPLTPKTFNQVSSDPENLAFPNDVAIDPASQKLYILMSNVPKLMYDRLDDKNKYIVLSQSLDTITHHCQPGEHQHDH